MFDVMQVQVPRTTDHGVGKTTCQLQTRLHANTPACHRQTVQKSDFE